MTGILYWLGRRAVEARTGRLICRAAAVPHGQAMTWRSALVVKLANASLDAVADTGRAIVGLPTIAFVATVDTLPARSRALAPIVRVPLDPVAEFQ